MDKESCAPFWWWFTYTSAFFPEMISGAGLCCALARWSICRLISLISWRQKKQWDVDFLLAWRECIDEGIETSGECPYVYRIWLEHDAHIFFIQTKSSNESFQCEKVITPKGLKWSARQMHFLICSLCMIHPFRGQTSVEKLACDQPSTSSVSN